MNKNLRLPSEEYLPKTLEPKDLPEGFKSAKQYSEYFNVAMLSMVGESATAVSAKLSISPTTVAVIKRDTKFTALFLDLQMDLSRTMAQKIQTLLDKAITSHLALLDDSDKGVRMRALELLYANVPTFLGNSTGYQATPKALNAAGGPELLSDIIDLGADDIEVLDEDVLGKAYKALDKVKS